MDLQLPWGIEEVEKFSLGQVVRRLGIGSKARSLPTPTKPPMPPKPMTPPKNMTLGQHSRMSAIKPVTPARPTTLGQQSRMASIKTVQRPTAPKPPQPLKVR